jgi:hypothetical protein
MILVEVSRTAAFGFKNGIKSGLPFIGMNVRERVFQFAGTPKLIEDQRAHPS